MEVCLPFPNSSLISPLSSPLTTMIRSAHPATLGNPLFLIKARMQAYSPALPVGAQHNYKNSRDALSSVVRKEGVRGLGRGVGSAMLRTAMVSVPSLFVCVISWVGWSGQCALTHRMVCIAGIIRPTPLLQLRQIQTRLQRVHAGVELLDVLGQQFIFGGLCGTWPSRM